MNEENNKEMNYDFDFENQVTKKEETLEETEVLQEDDDVFEEIDESVTEKDVEIIEEKTDVELKEEQNKEIVENLEETEESKMDDEQKNGKKIKVLGKEFLVEDLILIGIGLILIVSILVMPKIMGIFN